MSKVLSLRISDDLFGQLELLTKTTNRSKSFLTSKAIEEYLSRGTELMENKRATPSSEEANKGIFVSNESVEEWLSSWGDAEEKVAHKVNIFPK